MIKKMTLKKFRICILSIVAILLLAIFPKEEKLKKEEKLEYITKTQSTIYLLDSNNYLAMTSINLDDNNNTKKARKLLTALIQNEKYENEIPNGFRNIIPENTKILNINCKNNTIKVDFNKNLLNTSAEYEEKIIEAIVYTLTSIKDIKYVIIYIEGELLTHLPKNNITIPATLDRSFGINKEYNVTSEKNINKTTVYYMSKYNDTSYYIPVTKIKNSKKKKAEIIIQELSSIQKNNLFSYLNDNTEIVSLTEDNQKLNIDFNKFIYDDINTREVLEENINCIYLSLLDSYDVKTITLTSNNEEIYKSK